MSIFSTELLVLLLFICNNALNIRGYYPSLCWFANIFFQSRICIFDFDSDIFHINVILMSAPGLCVILKKAHLKIIEITFFLYSNIVLRSFRASLVYKVRSFHRAKSQHHLINPSSSHSNEKSFVPYIRGI